MAECFGRRFLVEQLAEILATSPAQERRGLCDEAIHLASDLASSGDVTARRTSASFGLGPMSVEALLVELGMLGKYGDTFAEYDLGCVGDLLALGEEECHATLAALGVTPNDRHRMVEYAFSHRPNVTCGSIYSGAWLTVARPLYSMHMGCENMGPLLYHLARFVKPRTVLEIGAGYTSLFLLQALADNEAEIAASAKLHRSARCPGWLVEEELDVREHAKRTLHCVDNLAHEQTTAHRVTTAARALGIDRLLRTHSVDAWQLAGSWDDMEDGGEALDMMWLDFGAGTRLGDLLRAWWPRLRNGGYVVIHSTLTNAPTRSWLDSCIRYGSNDAQECEPDSAPIASAGFGDVTGDTPPPAPVDLDLGAIASLSMFEPHKRYQNSCTIVQKRCGGYAEPIHSLYP